MSLLISPWYWICSGLAVAIATALSTQVNAATFGVADDYNV